MGEGVQVDARGYIIPTPKGPSRRYYSGTRYVQTNATKLERFFKQARTLGLYYGFGSECDDFAQECVIAYARNGACNMELARKGYRNKFWAKWARIIDMGVSSDASERGEDGNEEESAEEEREEVYEEEGSQVITCPSRA